MKKDTKENLKYFEITIILPKDNKNYLVIAPAKTPGKIFEAMGDIIGYVKKYGNLKFEFDEVD